MNLKFIVICLYCCCLIGCNSASNAASVSENASNVNQSGEKHLYQDACVITWQEDEDTYLEARVEIIKHPLTKETESLPAARLRIKNLTSGEIIYARDEALSFLTMYRDVVNEDVGEALVLKWVGGSAERMEILAVDKSRVRQIFYEPYRLDASLVNFGGDSRSENRGILLTTCDGGASPCYTIRFIWTGGKYQRAGRVPFERFANTIERQFGK